MKSIPATVPQELVRQVRTVGTGEAFWPISIAAAVARAYADAGLVIGGGEIYVAQGRAWGNMEVEWTADFEAVDGSRHDQVERGLASALAALARAAGRFGPQRNRAAEPVADIEDYGVTGEPMCFFAVDEQGSLDMPTW